MIFYPETGPQCPALPAGQACGIGIGLADRLAEADFSDSLAFFQWAAGTEVSDHLTGAPIFQAAGLNVGSGRLVVSDGLSDSKTLGSETDGADGAGGNWGAGVGLDSIFGVGAGSGL